MVTAFEIKTLILQGKLDLASAKAARLLSEESGQPFTHVRFNTDPYSLNSVNGIVTTATEDKIFFKFHTEEGEEGTVGEYYRAHILSAAGLPVDSPIGQSTTPGRQFLLYRFRDSHKLADICLNLERNQSGPFSSSTIAAAQDRLDRTILASALSTLKARGENAVSEPIHQLFFHRLADPHRPSDLGGRYNSFYRNRPVIIGGEQLSWEKFERLKWRVNDLTYAVTLRDLFEQSLMSLNPERLSEGPVTTSHGDAHNANIWVEGDDQRASLVMFDPAFAGADVPALLGEIKATFHNIFAHPFWLYTPEIAAARFKVDVRRDGDLVVVNHDWELGPLRQAFLESKSRNYWIPLLSTLGAKRMLPAGWEQTMRCALFCCPTLVMNMLPGFTPSERGEEISALSFAIAVMNGSAPVSGHDQVSEFFRSISERL